MRRRIVGRAALKRGLAAIPKALIAPIRERRSDLARDAGFVIDVLRSETAMRRALTERTRDEVLEGLGLFRR